MKRPPLLISLPCGLMVSGVTTFAVRLANGLAAAGRPAAILLHPEPAGCATLDVDLHPAVEVLRPPIPAFENSPGDLAPFIPHYRDAIRRLRAQSGCPVAFAPQMHADGFGIAAALCSVEPESLRVLGWQNSDIEYDARVLAHFEPLITRFIAVSDRIESTLKCRLARRSADIANIPYGVTPCRLSDGSASDRCSGSATPLRLLYTGRIEHHQKRILALAYLSDELSRRDIPHQITAAGDGPAVPQFDAAIAARPHIRRLPPQSPPQIAHLLRQHDAFILPSRYEGLSVSMLESMAAGCVPILSRTDSGARQAIEPGYNGEIADVAPEADEPEVARALADTVQRFLSRSPAAQAAMSAAASQTIADRFSIDRHIAAVSALIDAAAASPPRYWPADRPCAFSSSTQCSALSPQHSAGSVPEGGPARLRALLESLSGRTIIIHGAGQHTLQLGAIFASSPARIAAFTDDDRQRHGQKLWNWPIIAPADAAKTGATDIVISSWMHQDAIWARREMYERQGLRVHRLHHP